MNNLEKEAKKYSDKIDRSENGLVEQCFIAGAKSKYVEIEKLKYAVEQFNKIQINVFAAFAEFEVAKSASNLLVKQIEKLENQIKELENGI